MRKIPARPPAALRRFTKVFEKVHRRFQKSLEGLGQNHGTFCMEPWKDFRKPLKESKKNDLRPDKNSYQTPGKAFPFGTYWKKTFGPLALILYSENRQLESPRNKQMKVYARMSVNCSDLSQTWHLQHLRVKISNKWFRLFCFRHGTHRDADKRRTPPPGTLRGMVCQQAVLRAHQCVFHIAHRC